MLFSERVCNPCARKIRNLGLLYELVQSSVEASACKTPLKQSVNASKRLLETPPGSSPGRKSVRLSILPKLLASQLQFGTTAEQSQQALKDCIESKFNIDDLPRDGKLQVVSEEVANYTKSESILLLNEPNEIASISNTS